MESERTRKAAAVVFGLSIVGLVGVAPGAIADPGPSASEVGAEPCAEVDPDGPGLSVDPVNCIERLERKVPPSVR